MDGTTRIAIVGAGISGLSTHYRLECEASARKRALDVETWDPKPRAGGNIGTHSSAEGFRCEQAAESILYSRREVVELALDVGLGDRMVPASPAARRRYLVFKGRLHAAPAGLSQLLRGGFPRLHGVLRGALEPLIPRGPEDESVMDFGRRRLGRELAESVMDPMVTGVYAANPYRLSVRSGFPRIKELETRYGSLLLGLVRKKLDRKTPKPLGKGSFSFQEGMAEFVAGVQASLRGPVHQDRPLTGIFREGGRWRLVSGESEGVFDQVVLAIPAHALSGIPGDLPPGLREQAAQVVYNPVAVVCLGFDREQVAHPLDGFGFLCPAREKRKILGTLFSSTLWPNSAPSGKVLLRTMVGGGRQGELAFLPEDQLVEMVRSELADLLGIHGQPSYRFVVKWEKGIPEYQIGHAGRVEQLRASLQGSGLWLAGNAWDGIGVGECVAAAGPRACAMLSD
jgi:oxygen-dependent protoporphyrinogen oxidase